MIGVVIKTINSKYFKTFTQYPAANSNQTKVEDFSSEKNSLSKIYNNLLSSNINNFHQKAFSKSIGYSHLLDLDLQKNFITPEIFKEEEIQGQLVQQDKQKTYQSSLDFQKFQTIQFEANNPIQDRLVCKKLQSIDALCMSIFDGHGGNSLSEYASKTINQFIDQYIRQHLKKDEQQNQQKTQTIIKESIQWAYQQIQQKFYQILETQFKTGNKQILKVGSCAITAIIYQHKIFIANSGDSQSIIVTEDSEGLCYFKGNEQLSVNNVEEIKRVQAKFQTVDNQILVKNKYNKIYLKGFLEPTRTLGDYYLKKQKYYKKVSLTPFKGPYLNCKPDVNQFIIKPNFKHLILASDGLWDFVSKKQILQMIQQKKSKSNDQIHQCGLQVLNKTYVQKLSYSNNQKLTETLKRQILQKCAKKKGISAQDLERINPGGRRSYCDDISIIIFTFTDDS